jgi:hypothetical protein
MGEILRSCIHEAGHAVVSVILGQQLESVYVGSIWESERGSDFVSFKFPAVNGRVSRKFAIPWKYVPIIKGAGAAAEILWEVSLAPKEDRNGISDRLLQEAAADPRYRTDLVKAKNPVLWIKKASKLLCENWMPLVHTARYLNVHQRTTIRHETIAEICKFGWSESIC